MRRTARWLAPALALGLLLAVVAALAPAPPTSLPPADDVRSPAPGPPGPPGPSGSTAPGAPALPSATLQGADDAASLQEDWTIDLRFLDEAGEPFAQRSLAVRLHTTDPLRYDVRTDAEGVVILGPYRPPQPARGMDFFVMSETHDAAEVGWLHARPAADGAPRLEATITMVEEPVLRGRIDLPNGVPAPAAVAWFKEAGPWVGLHHGLMDGQRIPLDASGRFELRRWRSERGTEIQATVAHEGRRWFGRARVGQQERQVELVLGPIRPGDPALLHVRCVGPDGEPVMSYPSLFGLTPDGRGVRGVTLNDLDPEDGKELFLYEPDARLVAEAGGYGGNGHARVGPFPVTQTEVSIPLRPARVLAGIVTTEDGEPVEGARVRAHARLPLKLSYERESRADASDVTDAEGAFTLEGLGDLRYHVAVEVRPQLGVVEARAVRPGDGPLDIVVRSVPTVPVRVVDDAGNAVAAATVIVLAPPAGVDLDPDEPPYAVWSLPGEMEHVATGLTSEAGGWSFDGLAPEKRYMLRVVPPREQPRLARLEIQGWLPRDDTAVLRRGLCIEGRVEDEHGERLGFMTVRAQALGDVPGAHPPYRVFGGATGTHGISGSTAGDGTFSLGPVPAGRYELWVVGGDERVVCEAGAKDVVLLGSHYDASDGTWVFRIAGWRDEDRGAWLLLDRTGWRPKRGRVTPGGWVILNHVDLAPGREVWVGGLAGGRYVWGKNLTAPVHHAGQAADADPADLGFDVTRLDVEQGGVIRGRVATENGRPLDTWRVEPLAPMLVVDRAGQAIGACPCTQDLEARTFEIRGVPPGTWTLHVKGQSEGEVIEGRVDARPGESVVVRLGTP